MVPNNQRGYMKYFSKKHTFNGAMTIDYSLYFTNPVAVKGCNLAAR